MRGGPSPRVWGERTLRAVARLGRRTIPTRVGRTSRPCSGRMRCPDHPHACGENEGYLCEDNSTVGPSPRVWGEHQAEDCDVGRGRTSPTRVGRNSPRRARCGASPDHPHACGENAQCLLERCQYVGPSPRVWGELRCSRPAPFRCRTIPTRVGRTHGCNVRIWAEPDHPHACGENYCRVFPRVFGHGPSPRVWGELPERLSDALANRTIPTRVGRTPAGRRRLW